MPDPASSCRCHHRRGANGLRVRCTNRATVVRDADKRHVCSSCGDCNPADSEGFS